MTPEPLFLWIAAALYVCQVVAAVAMLYADKGLVRQPCRRTWGNAFRRSFAVVLLPMLLLVAFADKRPTK